MLDAVCRAVGGFFLVVTKSAKRNEDSVEYSRAFPGELAISQSRPKNLKTGSQSRVLIDISLYQASDGGPP